MCVNDLGCVAECNSRHWWSVMHVHAPHSAPLPNPGWHPAAARVFRAPRQKLVENKLLCLWPHKSKSDVHGSAASSIATSSSSAIGTSASLCRCSRSVSKSRTCEGTILRRSATVWSETKLCSRNADTRRSSASSNSVMSIVERLVHGQAEADTLTWLLDKFLEILAVNAQIRGGHCKYPLMPLCGQLSVILAEMGKQRGRTGRTSKRWASKASLDFASVWVSSTAFFMACATLAFTRFQSWAVWMEIRGISAVGIRT
jgi:hypothetical protein